MKEKYFTLSNGVKIPAVGFGTWQISNDDVVDACITALEAGYRHIDTALAYNNEKGVSQAIKKSGLKREDLFITTKLPAQFKGYDECLKYFNESLANLETDYIDLYLIHAPWPWSNVGEDCTAQNIETWKCMIDLYKAGKVKSIGVSNFQRTDIEPLIEATGFIPHVNQIRYFIGNTQNDIYDYCQKMNILIEAYSPLATGNLLNDPVISKIASKYNTTNANICLSYCYLKNTLPLPKSTHKERIINNINFLVNINDEDIKILDKVHNKELDRPLRS
ncbi:MAG: aldo/keto reductase [Acholeplasmatales bacterium]|nr:aldo/keto reductase [Acholeplasmatales bacterium]